MRRFAITVLSIFCVAFSVMAENEREFTVTGYGKMFYTVDMVDLSFTVTVKDKDFKSCKTAHDAIVDKLNSYLEEKKYGKEILSLQASSLNRHGANSDSEYYIASSKYILRTNRIKELSALQTDIVALGINEIEIVSLFSSKQRELEDEARKLALQDAREQAQLTAKELGWKLGKPTKVQYHDYHSTQTFGARGYTSGTRVLVASANSVDISVNVTFAYGID